MKITRLGALAMLVLCLGCARTEPIQLPGLDDTRLSDGTCPTIHCNTYQTDALPLKGPEAPSQVLGGDVIDHLWSSPIAGGILDYTYPDGTTVFWVSQVDRIMKLRLDEKNRLRKITELPIEPKDFPRFSPEDMQRIVAKLDAATLGTEQYDELADEWNGYQIEGLRAYYAMVSNKGILYVSNRNGVVAYGDAERGNPSSGIVKLGQYVFKKLKLQLGLKMPLPIMIGMNVTPDGHIIAVTIDGTVVGIKPDLSDAVYYNLPDEQIWNSIAIDERGGVYVPGTRKLHKLIWKNGGFSDDPKDGAWVEAYEIGSLDATLRAERGSGTTPALMGGPDDKDKFVVFADAANVNNLILYWRDEIPADWKQIPGTSSRRIAGLLPVDFGDKSLTSSYSENSATIFDYGAVLANNQVKTEREDDARRPAQDEGPEAHALWRTEVPVGPRDARVEGRLDARRCLEPQQHAGRDHLEPPAPHRRAQRRQVGDANPRLGHGRNPRAVHARSQRTLQPDHAGPAGAAKRRADLRCVRRRDAFTAW